LTAASADPKFIAEIARSVQFGERIKNAMIVLGQRPPARDPVPSSTEWLKHLISIYESASPTVPASDGQTMPWPLFPMATAPWPLLMPLSHSIPMREANYIWEAYKGDHGADRYHTYGPYRDPLTAMPDMLLPSRWFWNAFPDQIVHGGVCIQISKHTVDLYAALCKPAVGAAQPGHANLISYLNEGGTWKADIEQDFAGGAPVTYAQWFFDDEPQKQLHFRELFGWPAAEYHLGLAVGMNLGVSSYLDTRIASRIFQILPETEKQTLGSKLLEGAIQENPFNPEPWYLLATEASDAKHSLALLTAARAHNATSLLDGLPSPSLANFMASGRTSPAAKDMEDYWRNLEQTLARFTLLANGAPKDEAGMRDSYNFLKAVPGLDPGELSSFTRRFVGFQRSEVIASEVEYDQKLADQHDPNGCMRMGQRYSDGDGVLRDEVKAREYFIEAAQQGEPAAAFGLESINIPLSNDGVEVIPSSTYSPNQDVHHLIDGAGMTGGVHDNNGSAFTMWQTIDNPPATAPAPGLEPSPAWVRFNFAQQRTFDAIEIWNHNQATLTDRGFRKFKIYGSVDGKSWYLMSKKDAELPRASGTPYDPSVTVKTASSGRLLKSVIIAAAATDGNFGTGDYGLSAVRFVVRPVSSSVPSYQIQVHASSQYGDNQDVKHLIDGAGMNGEFHDNSGPASTMWQSRENPKPSAPAPLLPRSPAWVRFNFSMPRYVEAFKIWNHNQANLTNRGFKHARIYGTSDGVEWFLLTSADTIQVPKATGASLSAATTFFNVSPERPLRSVVIAAEPEDGNYGSNCYGLSAVRFIVPSQSEEVQADLHGSG
jgi:TPR repeat protein